jgi:hypothetical protein
MKLSDQQRELLRGKLLGMLQERRESPDGLIQEIFELIVMDDKELTATLDSYRATMLIRQREQVADARKRLDALEERLATFDNPG